MENFEIAKKMIATDRLGCTVDQNLVKTTGKTDAHHQVDIKVETGDQSLPVRLLVTATLGIQRTKSGSERPKHQNQEQKLTRRKVQLQNQNQR